MNIYETLKEAIKDVEVITDGVVCDITMINLLKMVLCTKTTAESYKEWMNYLVDVGVSEYISTRPKDKWITEWCNGIKYGIKIQERKD